MTAGALFVLQNALAAGLALALAELGFRGREGWRRGFAALAAFPLVAQGALLLASATAGLSRGAVLAVLALGFAACARALWRRPGGGPAPAGKIPTYDAGELLAYALAGGLLGAWLFETALRGTDFVWDDLSYHAALPAHWLAAGRIGIVPFTFQTYYPLNAELISLWFQLPFGRDAHANLAVAYWGVLAAAAIGLLVRGLDAPRPAAALAIAAFFVSYVTWIPTDGVAGPDLAAAAALLAACVFLIPAPGGLRARDLLACGLLAGFAAGCRVSFLPLAAVLGAVAVLRCAPAAGRGRALAAFAIAALASGGFWYLRNALVTGNPFFPAAVGPFEGPFDPASQAATRLASRLWATPADPELWRFVVTTRLHWPPGLALLAALGYAAALAPGLRPAACRSAEPAAALRGLRLALLASGATLLLLYPLLPFSATGNRPEMALHTGYLRFLLFPFAVGLVLFAAELRGGAAPTRLAAAGALLAIATAWRLEALLSLMALAAGGAVLLRIRRGALRAPSGQPARVLAASVAGLALLALLTPLKQDRTDRNLFGYRAAKAPIGAAWRALEALPAGARVAFFMAEPAAYAQLYPIFGRSRQLVPVAVERDGTPRRPLHETWRDGPRGWWSPWLARGEPLPPARLAANLARAGVDHALVSRWSLGTWPAQQGALRDAGASVVWEDGYSTLWKTPAAAAAAPSRARLPDQSSALLISIDTLRFDHVSRSGHARATTPYLDRLAGEGVYCSRAYAQSSWTLPSMLSLFASLSPAAIGIREGVTPLPRPGKRTAQRDGDGDTEVLLEYFSEAHVTLPEVLREHGFATAGFSTNGHLRVEQGFAQGFDVFDQSSCMWGTAACVFARAQRWLDEHLSQERPARFLLWVHLFDPHFDQRFDGDGPQPRYAPARGYEDLFGTADGLDLAERTRLAYDRKIRYADDRLREFGEALRERGLLQRSVLALAVDHGEEFDEHGLWGHSKSLRESLVRVPLLFRFPGGEPRAPCDRPVRNLDVAPTLLDALGLPAHPAFRGTSLLPAFRGAELAPAPIYGETRRFERDLRFYLDPAADRKLVLDLATGERQLFAPGADPEERRDLAAAEPERAAALERALRSALAEMEARRIDAARPATLAPDELRHLRALGYLP